MRRNPKVPGLDEIKRRWRPTEVARRNREHAKRSFAAPSQGKHPSRLEQNPAPANGCGSQNRHAHSRSAQRAHDLLKPRFPSLEVADIACAEYAGAERPLEEPLQLQSEVAILARMANENFSCSSRLTAAGSWVRGCHQSDPRAAYLLSLRRVPLRRPSPTVEAPVPEQTGGNQADPCESVSPGRSTPRSPSPRMVPGPLPAGPPERDLGVVLGCRRAASHTRSTGDSSGHGSASTASQSIGPRTSASPSFAWSPYRSSRSCS